jgi:hypothetical protein
MEIYRLIISFPYDEDEVRWSKTIDVQEDFTLYELHNLIQELVEFDDDHLYEFFISKNPRSRSNELPDDTRLNEVYPLTGLKLYYLFDFGGSWLFEIKKSRKKIAIEKESKYPMLVETVGVNPQQYPDYDD